MLNFINRKQIRQYILQRTRETRQGWGCTQVGKEALDSLEYKLKRIIDRAIESHRSVGKTFKDII